MGDDLRARAREAAEGAYRKPRWHVGTVTDRLIEAFYEGYLAHAAQQPSRDIDVDELARVIATASADWWLYFDATGPHEPEYIARAVREYLTGDESDE